MNKIFNQLKLQQAEKSLESWRNAELSLLPNEGWIRTIRTSLLMPINSLSKRLGITPAGLSKLERSEANGTITLNSLRRAAEALDCELKYSLVPRSSLKEMKEQQAIKKAKEQLRSVNHTMKLEDQEVDQSSQQVLIDELVKNLLESNSKDLWK